MRIPASRHLWLLLAFAVLATSCRRSEPPAEERWKPLGFINRVPATTEAYTAVYGLGPVLQEAAASAVGKTLLGALTADSPVAGWSELLRNHPGAARWLTLLSEAGAEEVFVALAPGATAQLEAMQALQRRLDAAGLDAALTSLGNREEGGGAPPVMPDAAAAWQAWIEGAQVPPVLFGAKAAAHRAQIDAAMAELEQSLPEGVEKDRTTLEGVGEFRRLRSNVATLLPAPARVALRDKFTRDLGDIAAAARLMAALEEKQVTLCHGWLGDYFVMSVGQDSRALAFSPDFSGSLAATPDLARLLPFLGQGVFSLSHALPALVAAAANPPPIAEYVAVLLKAARASGPAERLAGLEQQAAELQKEWEQLLVPPAGSLTSITSRDAGGWTTEIFGGSLEPRLAESPAELPVAGPPGTAFVWGEVLRPGYTARLYDAAGRTAAWATDLLQSVGPAYLTPEASMQINGMLGSLAPLVQEAFGTMRSLWTEALGDQAVMWVSLGGDVPATPFLPPAVAGPGKLPELAWSVPVRDRAALTQAWQSLQGLLPKVAPLLPAAAGGLAAGLPAPMEQTFPAGTSFFYALPFVGPSLTPNVTFNAKDRWILATSLPYAQRLAAPDPAAKPVPRVQVVALEGAPLWDFADAWLATMAAAPDFFNPEDPAAAAAQAATGRALVAGLRSITSFRYETWVEEGLPRRTARLSTTPAAAVQP